MVIFLSLLVLAWDDFGAVVQAVHLGFHKPVHPKLLRLYFYYMQQPHYPQCVYLCCLHCMILPVFPVFGVIAGSGSAML